MCRQIFLGVPPNHYILSHIFIILVIFTLRCAAKLFFKLVCNKIKKVENHCSNARIKVYLAFFSCRDFFYLCDHFAKMRSSYRFEREKNIKMQILFRLYFQFEKKVFVYMHRDINWRQNVSKIIKVPKKFWFLTLGSWVRMILSITVTLTWKN